MAVGSKTFVGLDSIFVDDPESGEVVEFYIGSARDQVSVTVRELTERVRDGQDRRDERRDGKRKGSKGRAYAGSDSLRRRKYGTSSTIHGWRFLSPQ